MADIATLKQAIKQKYDITNETTVEEILDLVDVVSVDELNAIKATSVIPLPNSQIKNNAAELKERFVHIATDEERGLAYVINKRMALLRIFLEKYLDVADETFTKYTDIVDNLTTEENTKPLSAKQGKVLKDFVDLCVKHSEVVNNLTSDNTDNPLSAKQGKMLKAIIDDMKRAGIDAALRERIDSVEAKIPTQATAENQLADKAFVNSSINNLASYPIRKTALGEAFATKAELNNATTFYSGGAERVPTKNDYTIILADETHENACTRYTYQNNQWEFDYVINDKPFTQGQADAIDSGITGELVQAIRDNASARHSHSNLELLETISSEDVENWDSKYKKPDTGIPGTDLDDEVQALLGKADTALQSHQDISGKVDTTTKVNGHALSGDVTITAGDVGLEHVDNTADIDKPVSTATQTELNKKEATANKTSTWSETPSDTKYPTEKLVKDTLDTKALITETGNGIALELTKDDTTFQYSLVAKLKDKNGNVISTSSPVSIDLPLESVVVSGIYNDLTQKVILTLQNGSTIEFSVAGLISGLQATIDANNMLSSDFVDDTNHIHKFVTVAEKAAWNAKYDKPANGIPDSDLEERYYKINQKLVAHDWALVKQLNVWENFGLYKWYLGDKMYWNHETTSKEWDNTQQAFVDKTWVDNNGDAFNFEGNNVWTDGEHIYYSNGTTHYELNPTTGVWTPKTWEGFPSNTFNGESVWHYKKHTYCAYGNYARELVDGVWVSKYWTVNGSTGSVIDGKYVWTDGESIYCTIPSLSAQYMLNPITEEWENVTIVDNSGSNNFYPQKANIWSDGINTFYCAGGLVTTIFLKQKKQFIQHFRLFVYYGYNVWKSGNDIYTYCHNNSSISGYNNSTYRYRIYKLNMYDLPEIMAEANVLNMKQKLDTVEEGAEKNKITEIRAVAGSHIGEVGTPTVDLYQRSISTPTKFDLEFNYLKGEKGDKGDKGDTGETGAKGEQGEQGIQGERGIQGEPGLNGTSCTHSWSGTTLTITSASGTSSANLKGEPGESYDDTEVRGLITTEANRAIKQENKALYFNGAFDSADGKTRQTGYAIFDGSDDEDWKVWDADQFRIVVPNLIQAGDSTGLVCSNRYKESSNWNYQQRIGIFNAGSNVVYQIFIRDNNYTLSTFKESLKTNPLIVQYKLATPYTDNGIIEGESLLPLDTGMANELRELITDGLNCWLGVDGALTSYTSHPYTMTETLKPNTTYTIYIYSDQNYTYEVGHWYLDNVGVGTIKDGILTNRAYTFTTPSSWSALQFSFWGTFKSGNYHFMLNEGNHPYSYEKFNGKLARKPYVDNAVSQEQERAVADNHKALYNLGAYDSISGNTITRQTGYRNVSKWIIENADLLTFRSTANGYQLGKDNGSGVFPNCYTSDTLATGVVNNSDFTFGNDNTSYGNVDGYILNQNWISLPNTYTTKESYINYFVQNEIIVEYKLTTPYTEQVIEGQPLNTLDQKGSQWLRDEWLKGLNLTNLNITTFPLNRVTRHLIAKNLPSGTYTLSLNLNTYTANSQYIVYINDNAIGTYFNGTSATLISNEYINSIKIYSNDTAATSAQVMLNSGSHPYPYQEHNGKTLHQKDIEPTLLWQNGSPNSAFEGQTVTTADMSGFKYLAFEYKVHTSNSISSVHKVKMLSSGSVPEFILTTSSQSNSKTWSRIINVASSTSITIGDDYIGAGATDNQYIIPVAIYGTDIL